MSVPIFEAVRRWILEGDLDDPHGEFFVASRRCATTPTTGTAAE